MSKSETQSAAFKGSKPRESFFIYTVTACPHGLEPKITYVTSPNCPTSSRFDYVLFYSKFEDAVRDAEVFQRRFCSHTKDVNVAVGKVFIEIDPFFVPVVIGVNSQ